MQHFIITLCLMLVSTTAFSEINTLSVNHKAMPWHNVDNSRCPSISTVEIAPSPVAYSPQAKQDTIIERDSTISEGTDFWVTFLKQSSDNQYIENKVFLSAAKAANVTIENPNTGWSWHVLVSSMSLVDIKIPLQNGYLDDVFTSNTIGETNGVTQRGIHIYSDNPIGLFASNFVEHSFDATNVLPTPSLGTDYIIQTYVGLHAEHTDTVGKSSDSPFFHPTDTNGILFDFYWEYPSIAAVVATDDNTQVSINPTSATFDGHQANTPYTINLNRGETYQLLSATDHSLSGTRISSNHPIAVFNGNVCSNVPANIVACDHLVEQAMPTNMWGTQFVVTSSYDLVSDQVIVTASEDNTNIMVNGKYVTTINARESYEFRLLESQETAFVQASQPVCCYLYISGGEINENNSDPSMVWISPIEQRIRQATFGTFQTNETRTHYVNIVTPTIAANHMTLDGENIGNMFKPVNAAPELSFARIKIEHATHVLANDIDGFIAHVYGVGWYESYAYNTGSARRELHNQMTAEVIWNLSTSCESDKYATLSYNITEGIDQVKITAINDRFDTTFNTTVPSSKTMRIPLYTHGDIRYVAYSYYNGLLMRIDTLSTYNHFPASVMLQKWNDFIGVQTAKYNGGYNFTHFEWYQNGELLAGENGSYLNRALEFGAEYSVLLTDDSGAKAFSCPIVAVTKEEMALYPTVATPRQNINVRAPQYSLIDIYSPTGQRLSTIQTNDETTTFAAPEQNGIYIIRLTTTDNQSRVYQLILQ